MFTAVTSKGVRTSAEDATFLGGEYFCPQCGAPVYLRNGLVKVEHFAHSTRTSCEYSGETTIHLQMKYQIFQSLKALESHVKSITLEKLLGTARPDIYIEGTHRNIAIEVQASALTPSQIISRTENYYKLGVYVLWVIPYDNTRFMKRNRVTGLPDRTFRVKEYERIIMQMSFKSLTLWDINQDYSQGLIVFKVGDSYTEGANFYDKSRGEHVSYNPRLQKTIKVIEKVKREVSIPEFKFNGLKAFSMSHAAYDLPARKLAYYNWPKENTSKSSSMV